MNQLIDQFRRLLFSGRRYDHSSQGVTAIGTPYQSSCWVVSRALCSYHLLDLNHVGEPNRNNALENMLLVQSPYERYDYWVAWRDGYAQVWVWDKDEVRSALETSLQDGDQAELMEVLPDSAFCDPLEDGLRLIQGLEGFTGQYWQSGLLRAERHWPEQPKEKEVQLFIRGAGAQVENSSLVVVPLTGVPWRSGRELSRNFRRHEGRVVTAAALVLGFLVVFELTTWMGLQLQSFSESREISELESISATKLRLREEVLDARDYNHSLSALRSTSQLELMARISKELPDPEGDIGRVKKWLYGNGDLEFIVESPSANLGVYARALDSVVGIGSVELEPNDRSGDLLVRAVVQ